MQFDYDPLQLQTRRHFLGQTSNGLGGIALASLLGASSPLSADTSDPLSPKTPPFPAKAKSVIYLHMAGSPPQHDLFDYKPKLVEMTGKDCPEEVTKGERFAFIKGTPKLLGTPHKFSQHGESGAWLSDLLPNLAKNADDLCFVKSMHTDQFNHAPAQLLLYTGSPRQGRPSMGSWVTYGLGAENENLPGFVVLISGGTSPSAGKNAWGSGFLPSVYQGVQCRSKGDPVLYVSNPDGMDRQVRSLTIDSIGELNRLQAEQFGSQETLTRIAQYELAFRMQVSVPEVMDIAAEPKHIQEAYGAQPGEASFANNCLLARRLVEQGVRFVQLFDWGWDFHGNSVQNDIKLSLPDRCKPMDQAVAALIQDLKERGLLDETLIVWSGEFGRTPLNEERNGSKFLGRDHHPHCYTIFLAGAGIKPGTTYGATDELGYFVAENPVHVHDLQATILHQLGFDHTRLTYRFQGRDYRLTDVHGHVVDELLI
ncbi:hypothetical protein KOR42_08260 [Thalassoglobus neptunius]|uniref:Sulfatase n=1 Tax=Thalassoglobus neptunius TaxID=1938619 RepID=A0A5C5X5G9_9PLAN|nr:DUF1501 domain-containing protein [Thalassoglobus neptunius]TWT57465.1 hypothetical protein KOR42_08260 [Thalassoglobus neptunius]